MKNLLIILSFVAMICGACMTTKEPVELKPIYFVKIGEEKTSRFIGDSYKEATFYLYRGDDKIIYRIPSNLGECGILYVRR